MIMMIRCIFELKFKKKFQHGLDSFPSMRINQLVIKNETLLFVETQLLYLSSKRTKSETMSFIRRRTEIILIEISLLAQ